MRKYSLLTAATLGLVAATTVAPSLAHAACSEPAGRCGDGEGKGIRYAAPDVVLDPSIGFNWTTPVYNVNIGVSIDLRALVSFGFNFAQLKDPVKGGAQPIYTVDLNKAPLAATWSPETKVISIKRVEGTQDSAVLDVRYTVRPNAGFEGQYKLAGSANFNTIIDYDYDLTDIFSDTIGNDNFGIDGAGTQKFKPWALGGNTPFLVTGGSLPGGVADPNSALFNQPWAFGDVNVDSIAANGAFGVYVKTDPEFSYKTLSVKYGNTELADDVVVDLPTQSEYGDSVKVPVKVRGGVRIDGEIQARPFLTLNQLTLLGFGPININHTFETGIDGLTRPVAIPANEDALMEFDFPSTAEVEIPIPNVKLVQQAAEFEGTVGSEGSTKVTIKNEGKAPAKITFETEGDFTISSQSTEISPDSTFDLTVKAKPSAAGTVTGKIKIGTNDPDTPFLDLDVNGEFKDAPAPPSSSSSSGGSSSGNEADGDDDTNEGKGSGDAAEDSGGCGCKTAGVPQSSSLGALGGLAFGMAALIRRRRKN